LRRAVAAVIASVFACALVPAGAAANDRASRVVDRTFSCEAGYLGGVYQVDVESAWDVDAQDRRRPSATLTTNLDNGVLASTASDAVLVNLSHCKGVRQKLPLTTKGLAGGATALGEHVACFTPRRVLLRLHAEYVQPVTSRVISPFGYRELTASGVVTRAEIAIGTLSGRPIAYASTTGTTKDRLFAKPDCREV